MELPGAKRLGDDRRPLGTLRCWRHSDIGPARGIVVTPALKEWSAAVHALLDGRQTVLLRKGGIGEKRRLVLSEERAGLLVVRSKGIDFVTTVTVAAAMVYIASTIDPLGTG